MITITTQQQFLNQIKPGAIQSWHDHAILPSLVGAQAALESDWGRSKLAQEGNNLFGVKGDYNGHRIVVETKEWSEDRGWFTVEAPFRKYLSWTESVADHGNFFSTPEWRRKNYRHVFGETDYKRAVEAILTPKAEASYATDPNYADKIIRIIEQHQLYEWDKEAGISKEATNNMAFIIIDIGHGNNTFPRNGKGVHKNGRGYAEHTFNSKLGLRLKELLEAQGHRVSFGKQQPNSPDVSLATRTNHINAVKPDLVISIHANAGVPGASGRCAFYWHTSTGGKRLAEQIIKEIRNKGYSTHGSGLHASVRGSWTNLHMTRVPSMVSVLVEHGFMTNDADFELIFGSKQDQYVEDMAQANAKAIQNYLGLSYDGGVAKTSSGGVAKTSTGGNLMGATLVKYEKARFEVTTDEGIIVRDAPSTKAKRLGVIPKGETRIYDTVYKGNGYRWVSYVLESTGERMFIPYRPESDRDNQWVEFKPLTQKEVEKVQAYKPLKKGDTATIGIWATQYQTGEDISDWIKGLELTVDELKDVDQAQSVKAYKLLNGSTVIGWVLEQDIVEADKGQNADNIEKMKEIAELAEEATVVESKTEDELADIDTEPVLVLEEGQFIWAGELYQISEMK